MDGDMNDIFQKLNSILADKETSNNLKNILNNFSSSNNLSNSNSQAPQPEKESSSNWTQKSNTSNHSKDFQNKSTNYSKNTKGPQDNNSNHSNPSGGFQNNSSNYSNSSNDSNNASSAIPDFDINTILKIKSVMDSLGSNKNDPRANLLLSLKPYLADSKKEKVDQYIKFLSLAKVIEVLNPLGGETKNE